MSFEKYDDMKKLNQNINPEEVLSTIDRTLMEIKADINSGELSKEEILEAMEGFDDIYVEALKIKIISRFHFIKDESPNASTHQVLIDVLQYIPEDLSDDDLKELINFTVTEWKKRKLKIAA